jgi:alpha-glucuronidase
MVSKNFTPLLIAFLLLFQNNLKAEDGYELWLRYTMVTDKGKLDQYRNLIRGWIVDNTSPTSDVIKKELRIALPGLLGQPITETNTVTQDGLIIIGTVKSPNLASLKLGEKLNHGTDEESYCYLWSR